MKVWVVASGEYRDYSVDFVAMSREAAVRRIREQYSDPKWSDIVEFIDVPEQQPNSFCVRFKRRVDDLCCLHDAWYDITEYDVVD